MSNENKSNTEGKITRIIIRICLALIVAAVLAVGGVYLSAKSLITMMTEPDKSEMTMLASAVPLVCTYNEIMANEDEYEELLVFIDEIKKIEDECTKSWGGAVSCLKAAAKKTGRLYRAQSQLKALASQTLKRIEAIEPYDESSAGLKKEIVSIATYANDNVSIINIVVNKEKISAELDRRFNAMLEGKYFGLVITNFLEKYESDLIILGIAYKIAPDTTNDIVAFAVNSSDDELTKTFMRSETFSRELNNGCLASIPEAKSYPQIALLLAIDELK